MLCFGNNSQGECLMLGSLEVDPEVRIHVQMACLGGTTRGKWQRTKKGGSQAWL